MATTIRARIYARGEVSFAKFLFLPSCALFAWLISHQPAVLFSHNKPAISNQRAVLFSQNKPAPAISHQPTEQAVGLPNYWRAIFLVLPKLYGCQVDLPNC
jgi:hypothetical protein